MLFISILTHWQADFFVYYLFPHSLTCLHTDTRSSSQCQLSLLCRDMTTPLGGLCWCLKMATDSFGNQTGSHEVTGRDRPCWGTQLLQPSCHSQRLQQAVHTSDRHPWLLLPLHGKDLIQILLFFLPSPRQFPHRTSYTVPLTLNIWVSPLRIRPESPWEPSCPLPVQGDDHTGSYWKSCWAVVPQHKRPAQGPWFASSLDTTFLWSYWEWQRHIRWVSERQMNVYTQKNAIH